MYKMQKYVVRRWLLDDGKRVDGRGINEIRPLAAEVGVLPRVHGSGMFIINPPYTLADTLAQTLPALTACLQQDDGAHFVLQHHSA